MYYKTVNIFKGGIGMNIDKAIEVLKKFKEWANTPINGSSKYDLIKLFGSIDTVVAHYEKSEKIEFLKSAKQPSEITHPYDLSKNRRQRNNHDGGQ